MPSPGVSDRQHLVEVAYGLALWIEHPVVLAQGKRLCWMQVLPVVDVLQPGQIFRARLCQEAGNAF